MKAKLDTYSVEELACCLLELNYDEVDNDIIDQKLNDAFNIDFDSFFELITRLVPLIDVGQSPISGQRFKGFSIKRDNHMMWLVKEPIK